MSDPRKDLVLTYAFAVYTLSPNICGDYLGIEQQTTEILVIIGKVIHPLTA